MSNVNIIPSDHSHLQALTAIFSKEADRVTDRWKVSDAIKRSDRKDLERRIKALVNISRELEKLRASLYATEKSPLI
jgi:hypothetical protein